MPTKTWVVGEEVLAADFNTMVQRQVVATFPDAAARDAAISAPSSGMVAWLADVAALQTYTGSAWRTVPAGLANNYAQIVAPSGDVANSPLIIPGLTIGPITSPGGRRWKLTASLTLSQTGTGPSLLRPSIREGATQLAGAFMRAEVGGFYTVTFGAVITPAAGPHTYDVLLSTDVGTAAVSAAPNQPTWHLVEDIG